MNTRRRLEEAIDLQAARRCLHVWETTLCTNCGCPKAAADVEEAIRRYYYEAEERRVER